MADEAFSYSGKAAATADAAAQGAQTAAQSGGFITDWLLNMFAGAIDIQVH